MAPTVFELKLKICSAKDLKNVNWRHGSLKPSVSAWFEPSAKFSTKVDGDGDTSPSWNETLQIPVTSAIDDSFLYLEIVHDKSDGEGDTKPIVGSARLSLRDVGSGAEAFRSLELRRPSGRPQGKIDIEISVKDLLHRPSDQYYAAPPYACAAPAYACAAPAYACAAPAYACAAPVYAYAAPYSAAAYSVTPPADCLLPSARHYTDAPSVYEYQVPSTQGEEPSFVKIYAVANENGMGTETELDVGAVAGIAPKVSE